MASLGGWSDLPSELLSDIAAGITELADVARFRSVCSSWRSAAAAEPPPQPPWLLLPSTLFFSPREDRIYPHLRLPGPSDAGRRRRIRLYASPHGWTLAVDPADLSASLLNPFTGAARPLPTLPAFFAETDDLAWDWSPHGVMVSCGEGILFCDCPCSSSCDSSDPSTTPDPWSPIPALADCSATSINYSAARFFVFEEDVCRTTVVDALTLLVAAVIPAPAVELPAEARLAVAGDDLFLLLKSKWMYLFADDADFTKAFRASHRAAQPAWQDLAGIGDRALFVDSLHGFAVPTQGFANLESNTVYSVTSREASSRRRTTVVKCGVSAFSLDTRTSTKLDCRLNAREMPMRGETPSWILPTTTCTTCIHQ